MSAFLREPEQHKQRISLPLVTPKQTFMRMQMGLLVIRPAPPLDLSKDIEQVTGRLTTVVVQGVAKRHGPDRLIWMLDVRRA
jgi:hypothetical protein